MEYKSKEDFKRLVKAAAALQGITLTEAAQKIGISKQQLSNTFSKAAPTLEDARRIAAALDCKLLIDIVPDDRRPGRTT